ncbi:hypothetical protein PWT90_00490 [Aphanocladium album]|nr:hypothetical protein PWT90_00490 [Aphanocladium album]
MLPTLLFSAFVRASTFSQLVMSKSENAEYFSCFRLNKSTFRIVEADVYDQTPFIYAKVYESTVVLIDTGCGGQSDDVRDSLKTFLETAPVAENGNSPINAAKRPYTIISTHCHFDHIGGMAAFAELPTTTIWASAHSRCFLSPRQLPRTSLCVDVGLKTPAYTITNWAEDGQQVTDGNSLDLNLTIYHTPGHTPDHLAIWDPDEGHLFVGDILYEGAPIYFLVGGNLFAYSDTLAKLAALVDGWNALPGQAKRRVQLAAGHITWGVDAAHTIAAMDAFLQQVMAGEVTPTTTVTFGRETRQYASVSRNLSFEGSVCAFDDVLGHIAI